MKPTLMISILIAVSALFFSCSEEKGCLDLNALNYCVLCKNSCESCCEYEEPDTTGNNNPNNIQDCEYYSITTFKLTNKTAFKIKGSVGYQKWGNSLGQGGQHSTSTSFTLNIGESIEIGEIYQGNISYYATRYVPDPDNLGSYQWEWSAHVQRTVYGTKCIPVEEEVID